MKRFAFPLMVLCVFFSSCGSDDGIVTPNPDQCVETAQCNDNNPCTVDECSAEGTCTYEPAALGTACESGDLCLIAPSCDASGTCVGTPRDCSGPEVPCIINMCDPQTGQCGVTEPNGTACDFNENDCTSGDTCQAGLCEVGTEVNLDDQNPCTQDACVKGEVVHEPLLEGQCDDGNECTMNDSCKLGTCVGGEPVECVIPECGASAECVQDEGCVVSYMPGGAECDDNDECTLFSVCDSQNNCVGGGDLNCDDGNECTDDYCAAEAGCWHNNGTNDCDDGDSCTLNDTCSEGACVSETTVTEGFTVDCNDDNALDNDGCCCWALDPLELYNSGHVLDLGEEYSNISMEVCLKPGGFKTCSDTAYIGVADNSQNWVAVASFETETQPTQEGGTVWQTYCYDVNVEDTFRYVHVANDLCWLDFVSVSLSCEATPGACSGSAAVDCDDGNSCTADSCDAETGACVHEAIEADWCLELNEGNNLVSFSHLPENKSLANVFGPLNPYVKHLFTEGKMAKNINTVGWVGNLTEIDRTKSYWIFMDYPAGTTKKVLELTGDPTDSDIKYQIHPGRNMMSFSSFPMPVGDALPDNVEDLFTMCIGQGVATIPNPNGDGWVGSLTTFKRNKGYEHLVDAAIQDFAYIGGDGNDPYTYGCRHPAANNYNASAHIDDGSCSFDLPENWGTPVWTSSTHHQNFLVLYDLNLQGAALESKDAVAAIVDGQVVGVGFPHDNRVTVPAIGDHTGKTVSYEIYDQSEGSTVDLVTEDPIEWSLNGFAVAGCTDPSKSNYIAFANLSLDVCVD